MDGKQIRKRVHLLFYFACILTLLWLGTACTRVPGALMGPYYFHQADSQMNEKNFRDSLLESQAILERLPEMMGDQALYRMGLIYIHPENENADRARGLEIFQRIVDEYPSSAWSDRAGLWVLILKEMQDREHDIRALDMKITQLEKSLEEKQGMVRNLDATRKRDTATIKLLRNKIKSMEVKVENLKEKMEELKKIDLGIEEKKKKLKS